MTASRETDPLVVALSDALYGAETAGGFLSRADCDDFACQYAPVVALLIGKYADRHLRTILSDLAPTHTPRSGAPVEDPSTRAALEGITARLRWPSMHWGTERVHPDAWVHIADAATRAVYAQLGYRPAPPPVPDPALPTIPTVLLGGPGGRQYVTLRVAEPPRYLDVAGTRYTRVDDPDSGAFLGAYVADDQ